MREDTAVVEVPEVAIVADEELPLPPPSSPGEVPDDELVLEVDGKRFRSWDNVQVTRGCERMPSTFTLSLTERFPGELGQVVIRPGQSCVVRIGRDTVLTGYVDRYLPVLDARQHSVVVLGRSKSQDLVDCSAVFDTYQLSGVTVRDIAATLARPYGIEVLAPEGDGPVVPQLNLQFGETTWDVIERLCRFAKFLCYDDPNGNIVLRPVSFERHASGVREGVNLKSASAAFTMDERFSEYHIYPLSVFPLMQANGASDVGTLPPPSGQARDDGVPRLRRRILILEHAGQGSLEEAAKRRAEWEQARRVGRSESIRVTVDSWRDSQGRLWEPNRLAPVHVPTCHVHEQEWTIAEVTFSRGESGTTASLILMPPRAFDPEYVPLFDFNFEQIRRAVTEPDKGSQPGPSQ
ncbi:phage baseplate assembly protein [Roseomonas xinghualingensis]|uniref:phage baseplate assembly protein n=1 Tax=Roseomonas xinghualingensis TaxID=2986475 RepID=UPI0021F24B2E|nr:hypothetical protein [Roseomonas sp. SXEYE001]MCV4207576.1 hypothetical protein [Roseomonas sp. SXEYE001]